MMHFFDLYHFLVYLSLILATWGAHDLYNHLWAKAHLRWLHEADYLRARLTELGYQFDAGELYDIEHLRELLAEIETRAARLPRKVGE